MRTVLLAAYGLSCATAGMLAVKAAQQADFAPWWGVSLIAVLVTGLLTSLREGS